ncbi:hypothetical protein ACS126_11490 [Sphingobacterium lactis]|uniref:hypothetical protein n=1 Tax=Sphingobacterium lactis TaxID=797291 RepID=UPI003EC74074
MQITEIPRFIVHAGIFSQEDLEHLARIDRVPTDQEIDAFQFEPEVQELLNAFIGDETTRRTHQLLKAKEYLAHGELEKAWKMALL